MTKKLVEEPILVKNKNVFDELNKNYARNQKVICICEKCGGQRRFELRRASYPFTCNNCSNGKKRYNRKDAINNHNLKFINTKDIEVICKKCSNIVKTTIKAFDHKVQRYGAFYCKDCLDKMLHEKRSLAQKNSENTMRGKHFSKETLKLRNKKREETIIKNYGSVENFESIKSEKISKMHLNKNEKEIQESNNKRKETCRNKYGVDNVMKVKEIADEMVSNTDYQKRNEKINKTLIERYGSLENYYNNVLQSKTKESCLKKFGVEYAFQSEQVKNSIKKTMLEKYGVDNFSKSDKFQSMLPEIMKKSNKRYYYKNLYFDSSWELAYYIWLEDNKVSFEYKPSYLTYKDNKNIEHRYFPDFKVNGSYVEIKGDQFFNENGELGNRAKETDESKFKFLKENGIEIIGSTKIRKYLGYVKETYGKDYLKSFKK